MLTLKTCTSCKRSKQASKDFSPKHTICKQCNTQRMNATHAERKRLGVCACGAAPSAGMKTCSDCRVRSRAWHIANRDKVRQHKINFRIRHAARLSEYRTERWAKNINGVREKNALWRQANRQRLAKSDAARYAAIKTAVFDHYGQECACCGNVELGFLTIDHINGGGRKHRLETKMNTLYGWLYKNDFPEGFQTLCYNCNCGRARNKGICPHQSARLMKETSNTDATTGLSTLSSGEADNMLRQ